MSFNLVNNLYVLNDYKKISENFCKFFYEQFDNNFQTLCHIFLQDALITFMDKEFVGVNGISSYLYENNIYKFEHQVVNGCSQPIDCNTILINTWGHIVLNDTFCTIPFTETFILIKKNSYRFFIKNWIFRM